MSNVLSQVICKSSIQKLELVGSKMNENDVVLIIKHKLTNKGGQALIPLQRGGYFKVKLVEGGIEVDNLGSQPFLPWQVFKEAVVIMIHKGGAAKRGNAMDYKLGSDGLPFDSIEGYIASVVYKKKAGDSVFRRITPISCILKWAGICENKPGKMILL
jgi:hypothetical protein